MSSDILKEFGKVYISKLDNGNISIASGLKNNGYCGEEVRLYELDGIKMNGTLKLGKEIKRHEELSGSGRSGNYVFEVNSYGLYFLEKHAATSRETDDTVIVMLHDEVELYSKYDIKPLGENYFTDDWEKRLAVLKERDKKVDQLLKEQEDKGLKPLTGSEKQIKWALIIRKKYIEINGIDSTVKRTTKAGSWINNHKHLTYNLDC